MTTIEELKKYRYAHRGFHDKPLIPENSMAAFKRAKERGFGCELDVHLMKDGNLCIIHDSNMKRVTGKDLVVEELTKDDLKEIYLEESSETIPMFEDVLSLKLPLIVELKVYGKNIPALCQRTWDYLKDYDAPYCVESFHPGVVSWFKKNHPEVIRGQLSQNFMKEGEVSLSPVMKYLATNLVFDIFTKPHFDAYKFEDRESKVLRRHVKKGMLEVNWTIRSKEDMLACEKDGGIPIFEKFDPEV